jgi:hypothetical protein
MTRPHDVGQLTTAELDLTRRQLPANLALIALDSPAEMPILPHIQRQSTPSSPHVPGVSSQAQASAVIARTFPACSSHATRRASWNCGWARDDASSPSRCRRGRPMR